MSAPSRFDPVVHAASQVVGGPWGRYAARPGRPKVVLAALLLLAGVFLAAGYVQKSPCADGAWVGSKQYTHFCYSDVIPLWGAERLDVGAVPYRDTAVEYPVLTGGFMWVSAELTGLASHAVSGVSELQLFGIITCLGLAFCGLVTVAGTAGAAGRRPWDAAIAAASPLLVFHAFSNWDLLAMAFAMCGLWAWARQRPVLAGVLIGLGTAAKLYPVFLLVAIGILAWRTGRWRQALWAAAAAAAAWLATNVPIALAWHEGWWEFYSFSADRTAEASTFWYMGNYLATVGLGDGFAPAYVPPSWGVALALLVGLAAVAYVSGAAPYRPRLAQVAFLVVLAFLLTTKVWSPQYSLWLVPLVALARPRWRLALVWQFAEIAVWMATLLWLLKFGTPTRGLDYGWLMTILLLRDVLLLAIAAGVVRDMWRPDLDVVRGAPDYLDDPGGGTFDGALDRRRLPTWHDLFPPAVPLEDDEPDDGTDPEDLGDFGDAGELEPTPTR
ncbi:glycosyltransferase family 87 protein [Jatrophihabitans sp. YIM 134969]